MTLKEKFQEEPVVVYQESFKLTNQSAEQCEQIAEDFAIGFAEWCDDNYFRMGNTYFWAESMDWDNDTKFTSKELLEIYKKEKGL